VDGASSWRSHVGRRYRHERAAAGLVQRWKGEGTASQEMGISPACDLVQRPPVKDARHELIDGIAGVVLTHLSGLAARCSSDLTVRHRIDAVVHQVRTEIAEHCIRIADEAANRP
jgi:hypothetical protein